MSNLKTLLDESRQIRIQIHENVMSKVRGQIHAKAWDQARMHLHINVWHRVSVQARYRVLDQVFD